MLGRITNTKCRIQIEEVPNHDETATSKETVIATTTPVAEIIATAETTRTGDTGIMEDPLISRTSMAEITTGDGMMIAGTEMAAVDEAGIKGREMMEIVTITAEKHETTTRGEAEPTGTMTEETRRTAATADRARQAATDLLGSNRCITRCTRK